MTRRSACVWCQADGPPGCPEHWRLSTPARVLALCFVVVLVDVFFIAVFMVVIAAVRSGR